MQYPLIDTREAVTLFERLIAIGGRYRILSLVGESKMGKSHLLTKVLPELAQNEPDTTCAKIDLRESIKSISELLHLLASQIGDEAYLPEFYSSYNERSEPMRVEANQLRAFFALVHLTAKGVASDSSDRDRRLTTKFVGDIKHHSHSRLIIFIDSVEKANADTLNWLTDSLLVKLIQLNHVRVVISGLELAQMSSTCAAVACIHKLSAVRDITEYIAYCRQVNANLTEQSIRDLALALDHVPGLFAQIVEAKFSPLSELHG